MSDHKDESSIHVVWLPLILGFAVLYILSAIDFIPDVLPIFGRLDDLAIAIGLVWFFTSWLPKNRHRIYWFKSQSRNEPRSADGERSERAAADSMPEFDPFKILNVSRGASVEEIKHAYREMLSKYHPDKVAHLGEEFQQMAHGKVIEITKAYEMLCGKG